MLGIGTTVVPGVVDELDVGDAVVVEVVGAVVVLVAVVMVEVVGAAVGLVEGVVVEGVVGV